MMELNRLSPKIILSPDKIITAREKPRINLMIFLIILPSVEKRAFFSSKINPAEAPIYHQPLT